MLDYMDKYNFADSSAGVFEDDVKTNPLKAGYGRCRSCDCTGYVRKKRDTCECGHNFTQHW